MLDLARAARVFLFRKLLDQQRYRKRQTMVEPVFSQLRSRQGLRQFRRKGLSGVKVEFALHAMAYNLGRALVIPLLRTLYQSLGRETPALRLSLACSGSD